MELGLKTMRDLAEKLHNLNWQMQAFQGSRNIFKTNLFTIIMEKHMMDCLKIMKYIFFQFEYFFSFSIFS